jgi:predicted alpha-1,2-mannosidase
MKKASFVVLVFLSAVVARAQSDYTYLVNPFIGTGGHGHTFPGASAPFGMVQLGPDTRMADWDGSSGYHYSDSVVYGFSHTHLSGTGIPDYCDLLLMPFTGPVHWKSEEYRSRFSHQTEKASPGYYEVMLEKQKIRAQLTATPRTGFHQYSFPLTNRDGRILIDLVHRDAVLDAHLEKVSDHEIRGYRRSRSWATDQSLYFYIRFENPITAFEFQGQEGSGMQTLTGKSIRAYVKTALSGSGQLRCQVGLSGVSMEGARANLDAETNGWDFAKTVDVTKQLWNRELNKVDLKGGTRDQQTVFYTALYHTFLVPNLFQDVDGQYRGTDGKNHRATGFTNYTVFSLWDTYRAYHPLMTILDPKRTTDWIKTFLHQYENGGMLPVWELAGNETFCMIGYHSIPVIWDAWQKGIRGFDAALALKAARSYAESDRFGLDQYRQQGYISNDHEHESVSKTLEYAYDDWCISQLAAALGQDSVADIYRKRAQSYKNVFDPQTHHMRGRIGALWQKPFDPREINNFFTEGNSWQYSFAVPQDIDGLMRMHGGPGAFAQKLDELFTTSSTTTGRDQADVTGLIGQYAQGNEPSHHMAYLFTHAGQPWRTQELVHRICTDFYKNTPDGLIGNEDCGQMSAWFVLSSMGLYPVTPGSGEYVLGTPLFDEVTLHLGGGTDFVIRAKGKGGPYVSAVTLQKKPYGKSYITHADLLKGGELTFHLSDKPAKNVGAEAPHSAITGPRISPAPYVDIATNKFRDSLTVILRSADPSVPLYYFEGNAPTGERIPVRYERPFTIHGSTKITLVQPMTLAPGTSGNLFEHATTQFFYKLPTDRTIQVSSRVHPLYTGGGNELLIDGLEGSPNWRSGDWQSYFDTDFEAVIDLLSVRPVSFVGVHVLQDVSPWILYPREVVFLTSVDGKTYSEAGRVTNSVATELKPAETQVLGAAVNTTARYIRVRAINGGRLPAWHESAGNPSHLFIDEVIVR